MAKKSYAQIIVVENPQKTPDRYRNQISFSFGHARPLHNMSSKSVHNFFDLFSQLKDRQTENRTLLYDLLLRRM